METINKYTRNYSDKYQCYEALKSVQDKRIEKNRDLIIRANKSIDRAERKINNIPYPYWTKEILEYMAKDMLQYFPEGSTYEIMGPFGITSKTSIWIKCKDYDDKKRQYGEPFLYSFEVTPSLGNVPMLYRVDTNTNTGEYPEGTIGEINGMNNPSIAIRNDITLKEFILLYYPNFKFKNL